MYINMAADRVVQSHSNCESISFGMTDSRSQQHSDMLASSDCAKAFHGALLGCAEVGIKESLSCCTVAFG